jgi:hypothetical protein
MGWFIQGFGGIVRTLQNIKPRKIIANQKNSVRAMLGIAVAAVMVRSPLAAAFCPTPIRTNHKVQRKFREMKNK